MTRRNTNKDRKSRSKDTAAKKSTSQSTGHKEDFNTGSHSPSSLLNVGPGYDDTGMGNDSEASDPQNANRRRNKQKRDSGKK